MSHSNENTDSFRYAATVNIVDKTYDVNVNFLFIKLLYKSSITFAIVLLV